MDEAWLSGFVPSTSIREEKPVHGRKPSLLQHADASLLSDVGPEVVPEEDPQDSSNNGPPTAEVMRRAASWHHLPHRHGERSKHSTHKDVRRKSLQLERSRRVSPSDSGYDRYQDELIHASHEDYELYYEQLELTQNHLDTLLESTNASLELLGSLSESFRIVEDQTNAFHEQCQSILAEQRTMHKLADDIKENLQYYAYLEPITRRLNAPGASTVVTRSEFPEMLTNLDACLDYMQGHPGQREAATYQARYRLLLTRALTLVRVHFTETLRALASDVSKRIADKQLNDTTQSALLYAKFRINAAEMKDLGLEILKRAVPPANATDEGEAEYQSLMNELYQSYSTTRGRLIYPLVTKRMSEIAAVDSSVRDLVAFARGAIGFIRGICLDEYDLWCEWFVVDGAVYEFLESICEPLFDHIRPRIIHETKLAKLCELCTFLQTSFVENDSEDDDPGTPYLNGNHRRKLNFAELVQPVLADAQTRLVFLTLSVLRDEIEYYKPKQEDLDYPQIARRRSSAGMNGKQPVLSGRKTTRENGADMKKPSLTGELDNDDEEGSSWAAANKSSTIWYPTLPRSVRLLSRIYRLVNSTVFDDLAHRIVHCTTLSLVGVSSQIATKASPTDGQLFLISHLLRLKQQIVAFDIEFVAPEITFDFSSLTNTFYELRDRGGLWNPSTWYRLASGGLLPRVVENMLDAKAELDGRLRVVINDFVNSFAGRITAPLTEISDSKKKGKDGAMNPKRSATAVRGLAEKTVVFLRKKLEEYLDDVRTRETLVAAVKDQVILAYENWLDLSAEGNGPTRMGKPSKKGKGREDEIWSADVFADWCDVTFGTAKGEFDGDENGAADAA